ncbi:MAG: D-alanyl-D-alanine carboxypeptidase [Clostridiales bacterium]|nr:D-alanyl-D-alanine carboxypeptidase [Clostridiales bacterium]
MFKLLSFVFAFLFIFPINVYAGNCSASSAVVMDADTNEILFQKNPMEKRSIASTTKIMSSIIACESGKMDETVEITFEMVNTYGTLLGLREGDKITLYDLVAGMLLPSGNDAANAAALYLGGSFEAFAEMMNEKAAQIGMKNSLFVTPSGLDEGEHHSTAYDMALLTSYSLNNKYFSEICSMKKYEVSINGEKQMIYNHNKLLSMLDDCIGVKTGFTDKAGRCLVSAVNRNGRKMVCVTLNAPDDWNDHISLYSECESKYNAVNLKDMLKIDVVGGNKNSITASYSADVYVVDKNKITVELYAFPFLYSPVKEGDEIGKAVIKYKEKELKSVPITADENVEYYYAEQE